MSSDASAALEEPEAVCDEANEPLPLGYGAHTAGCSISPATDLDRFVVWGEAGDVVRINVYSTSNYFDPALEVRDPTGAVIAIDPGYCSGGGSPTRCSFTAELLLDQTGNHQLTMTDAGGNEAGGYVLQVERVWPAAGHPWIDYDSSVADSISPQTDVDLYFFEADADTEIRLSVYSTSNYFDPRIEVWDPNGAVVVDQWCSGGGSPTRCSFSADLLPEVSGTYLLAVSDVGTNETGNYQIGLTCIFDACDSDGDGTLDPDPSWIDYDSTVADSISPQVDSDPFLFEATAGTQVRLNVHSKSNYFDPRLEIRDPDGNVLVDQYCSGGGSPTRCSFSVDLVPDLTGTHSILLSDAGTNETGSYEVSLFCLHGPCDSDGAAPPDGAAPVASYVSAVSDTISPAVDGDPFRFWGTEGTRIRLNLRSWSNYFDPRVEIRDPEGNLVADEWCNGGGSPTQCSFSRELSPALTGWYRLMVSDVSNNEVGSYEFSLHCLQGECDSDGDGIADGPLVPLDYGAIQIDAVSPVTDLDLFTMQVSANTAIRFNVLSSSNYFDPHLEVWDEDGNLVVDQWCSGGGSPTKCSFSVEPVLPEGTYTVALSDVGSNEAGGYQLALHCLFGSCSNPPAPPEVGDNCIEEPNGPAIPDAGGNVQLDTDADGFGNACDPDYDGDGVVGLPDFSVMSGCIGLAAADLCEPLDHNGDGVVGLPDFSVVSGRLGKPPGPSGLLCAGSVPCPAP